LAASDKGAAAEWVAIESRPTVVVFTHSLLEPSMTFILSHALALRRYQAVFAGAHRVPGLSIPAERVFTANRGGILGDAEELLFRRFRVCGRFASRLSQVAPRLVHAHFGLSGPAALTLASSLHVPLIVTYHGQDATISDEEARKSWRGREYLRGRRELMHRTCLFIAVSDFIRSRLIATGFPEQKIVTHRNGIDLKYFCRRPGAGRDRIVVFVGRFVEKKGCEYLLRALAYLRVRGLAVKAVLIGDGPLRQTLERMAAESGVDCEFTGLLPLEGVRGWLECACAAVVPSVTASDGDSEGLPTVILEAQALETPVVTTRHAGNVEGVVEGRTALVVAERDVEGLAEAIRTLLENPGQIEAFGTAARAFVERQFSLTNQAAGLELLYDRVRAAAKWH
jgi:glycosyltransferase involved in cell wall biosynthesis